jgi:tRNA(fMet)-specific endonuclease VapC
MVYLAIDRPEEDSIDERIALIRFIVLRSDAEMARHRVEITAHRRRLGRPIECGDAWIAASALRYAIPPLSHNAAHGSEIPGLTGISHSG